MALPVGNTAIANTHIFAEEWAATLQLQLDEPTKWKDFGDVQFTDMKVYHNPYQTDISVQTHVINSAYSPEVTTQTDESVTLSVSRNYAPYIDRADLSWSYAKQMYHAGRAGTLLNEAIETVLYANHGSLTNFGVGDITGGSVADTTQITVSATNIDDIVTHLRRVISVAQGDSLFERNGGFIVWRPADFQLLTQFAMANGFATADLALRNGFNGNQSGFQYMGFTHYSSNLLATNHVIAGIKNIYTVAILNATYGKLEVAPGESSAYSGIFINQRVDFNVKAWANTKTCLFDVNVV